jgi:hypothetical protein
MAKPDSVPTEQQEPSWLKEIDRRLLVIVRWCGGSSPSQSGRQAGGILQPGAEK